MVVGGCPVHEALFERLRRLAKQQSVELALLL